MKTNEVCKITNNAFEKYLYSNLEQVTPFHIWTASQNIETSPIEILIY
jgi:hypothetical protein